MALAHKGKGRVVVDIQPDGDLMFDAGALWVAAKHQIPMLVVMHNNRAYYNDWEHQITHGASCAAPTRRRRHIGMDIVRSGAGFRRARALHGLVRRRARSTSREDIAAALKRAIAEVKKGRPALVDTITQHR